jgi:hypothetical protein
MSNRRNITAYISKKYTIEKNAFDTATSTLNKLIQDKIGLTIDDLPDTPDMYDIRCEASTLIKSKQYENAADVLINFVEDSNNLF